MAKRMSLREKYRFDDFTEAAYRQCLRLAKSRYSFISYSDFDRTDRVCLWRHDIDTSPQRALALGKIETEEGVKSTFFLLFHSDRYNAFDYEVHDIMLELIDLGHDVGLHFDPMYYGDRIQTLKDLEGFLEKEKDLLSDLTQKDVHAFSFHNPSTSNLMDIDQETIGGMVNAYNSFIKQNFKYCSDSFCYWRHDRLLDVLKDENIEKLHILTHPVCWTPDAISPYMRFKRAIAGRANFTLQRYLRKAKENKRKIIR